MTWCRGLKSLDCWIPSVGALACDNYYKIGCRAHSLSIKRRHWNLFSLKINTYTTGHKEACRDRSPLKLQYTSVEDICYQISRSTIRTRAKRATFLQWAHKACKTIREWTDIKLLFSEWRLEIQSLALRAVINTTSLPDDRLRWGLLDTTFQVLL